MALYNDVATILNSLNAMARGEDAVASVDLTGAIAAVKSNIDSDDYKDAFMQSLCTVISKYTNRITSFRVKYPAINVTEEIFGGMAVKNDIAPFEAVENTATGTGANNYAPDYTAFKKPTVEQKFFIGFDKWAEKMKLPDDLFETAFHNSGEMAAFLSAVMEAFSDAQIPVHQTVAEELDQDDCQPGKGQGKMTPLCRDDSQKGAENDERKAAHGTGEAEVQRRFCTLQPDAEIQVDRVDGHHRGHVQYIAGGVEQVVPGMNPQQYEQNHLHCQKHIDHRGMAEIPVPVNLRTQHRTEQGAAHIAQGQDEAKLRIGAADALQVNCGISCDHAEGHPEASGDDHVVEGYGRKRGFF